jgi:hypothetical protein
MPASGIGHAEGAERLGDDAMPRRADAAIGAQPSLRRLVGVGPAGVQSRFEPVGDGNRVDAGSGGAEFAGHLNEDRMALYRWRWGCRRGRNQRPRHAGLR